MKKRRLHIVLGSFLLMLLSIGLSISTLHSHHNLELHNSADFADTGQCLNSDTTLCPICAYLVQTDVPSHNHAFTILKNVEEVSLTTIDRKISSVFVVNTGRSPPFSG